MSHEKNLVSILASYVPIVPFRVHCWECLYLLHRLPGQLIKTWQSEGPSIFRHIVYVHSSSQYLSWNDKKSQSSWIYSTNLHYSICKNECVNGWVDLQYRLRKAYNTMFSAVHSMKIITKRRNKLFDFAGNVDLNLAWTSVLWSWPLVNYWTIDETQTTCSPYVPLNF